MELVWLQELIECCVVWDGWKVVWCGKLLCSFRMWYMVGSGCVWQNVVVCWDCVEGCGM